MEAKLYVGNLSYETAEQDLRDLFMQAGTVVSVALIKEPGRIAQRDLLLWKWVHRVKCKRRLACSTATPSRNAS